MKDVRQCENKHKFCYSCIFVWSTSGSPVNHSRCPVCRVEGLYVRNNALDEKINSKTVKCSLKSCKWNGALKFLPSHQHTTYSGEVNSSLMSGDTAEAKGAELPTVGNNSTPRPCSNSRSRAQASNTQVSLVSHSQTSVHSRPGTQRQPLSTSSLNNSNNTPSTNRNTSTTPRTNTTTTRSRTRSRHRQNSSSPQRRSNITATGLNSRLTSRARIQNNGTIENRNVNNQTTINQSVAVTDENQNSATEQTTTEPILVPHPPRTPRPHTQTPRRLPTLPNLIPINNTNNRSTETPSIQTDNNNNISTANSSSPPGNTELPRRFTIEATIRRQSQPRSFGMIRERLQESRQRLDMLMTVFSAELDRGRQDLTSFQQERERRRQEQLAEVRHLGQRLTQVAQELRGLLSQRRQIRHQMDHLLDSGSED